MIRWISLYDKYPNIFRKPNPPESEHKTLDRGFLDYEKPPNWNEIASIVTQKGIWNENRSGAALWNARRKKN